MKRARSAVLIGAVLVLGAALPAPAQTAADEGGVRAALAACVDAWNRHQAKAFGDACLTEDVWFSETDDSFYKRFQGREKVLQTFGYNIESSDLQWEVRRIKALPDGTLAVELKQSIGVLPRTNDRYASVFDSSPSFARLRRDGGVWRVYFFTSHTGWARALLLALDRPPATAAAALASAGRPDPIVPPGLEPPAYTMAFGLAKSSSCLTCHGRPPSVSEDGARGRIIASAAAAAGAAGLRRLMAASPAGGGMGVLLDDPALTDERLDAIRLWMRALRDGRAERVGDRIVIHNQRSERDPPVHLALLRAEGGWKLPTNAGCRQGAALKGGTQCELRLPPGSKGALVFRFAPSHELQPQEVRLALE